MGSRVVSMKYHSQSSRQLKAYTVHPYRLVHAQGGLYLVAYVPDYGELRTFAVARAHRDDVAFLIDARVLEAECNESPEIVLRADFLLERRRGDDDDLFLLA
jgi:predicted DNA-binding transcriptional regulator YafY